VLQCVEPSSGLVGNVLLINSAIRTSPIGRGPNSQTGVVLQKETASLPLSDTARKIHPNRNRGHMQHPHLRFWIRALVALCASASLVGCDKPNPSGNPVPAVPSSSPSLNTVDPDWVFEPQRGKRPVVVFVHGIFGDTMGTWTNPNGATFF